MVSMHWTHYSSNLLSVELFWCKVTMHFMSYLLALILYWVCSYVLLQMEYLRHVLVELSRVPSLWQVECVQRMWRTVLLAPLSQGEHSGRGRVLWSVLGTISLKIQTRFVSLYFNSYLNGTNWDRHKVWHFPRQLCWIWFMMKKLLVTWWSVGQDRFSAIINDKQRKRTPTARSHCDLVTPYGVIDLGQHWFR